MHQRILALDVFRGMTIFFMILVNTPGNWQYVYAPLKHAKWDGCTPTDLVFPFFVCIVGISMAITYNKYSHLQKSIWIQKAIKRGMIIILIGVLLNWFPFYHKHIFDLRLMGVLQRIGLAFLFAAILVAYVPLRYFIFFISILLLGYFGLMISGGVGALTLEENLVRKIDLIILGENHLYTGYGLPFDPEGLLSTLPTIGTVLIGYWAGRKLMEEIDILNKIKTFFFVGTLLSIGGLVWSYMGYPINKPLWSSSYVLFTSGLAMMMLALLIWIIDVHKIQKWTYIFKAFGQNPLACFVLSGLIVKIITRIPVGEQNLYQWFYTFLFQQYFGDYFGSLMFALSYVLLIWCVAYIMERKNIMIKI